MAGIIPDGSWPDPLDIYGVNYLTGVVLQFFEILINIFTGPIGKAFLVILLLMFTTAVAYNFFKYFQEIVHKSYEGWDRK